MITIVPGPEASYASIDGAWLNQEPYFAFHRVCVKDSPERPGPGCPAVFRGRTVCPPIRHPQYPIDTHPDNQAMQRAWLKAATSAAAP